MLFCDDNNNGMAGKHATIVYNMLSGNIDSIIKYITFVIIFGTIMHRNPETKAFNQIFFLNLIIIELMLK